MAEEYISRQAAIDAVETIGFDLTESDLSAFEQGEVCEIIGDMREDMIRMVRKVQPADVVEVVHARWIKYTGMGKVQWMCSKCSAEEKNPKVANYCYHCGAKMDGEE